MEGRGPHHIYDPGGSAEASAALERLVEENARLKGQLQGVKTLGQLLGESQMEASRLRQKAEALVGDSPPLSSVAEVAGKDAGVPTCPPDPTQPREMPELAPRPPSSGSSSEFELVGPEEQSTPGRAVSPQEPGGPASENLQLHLQRLESALSVCAREPDHGQLFTHLGRMALEFNRLAAKVHSNETRTSALQTLCEQLRQENQVLKAKLDQGLEQRDRAAEQLREENAELRRRLGADSGGQAAGGQQAKLAELGAAEKKVKMLEQQRLELLDVNKQWDQHFRSMKQQCEQKITELRQKLAAAQAQVAALEAEREQKQRDFDRKLLLAKSKIQTEETDKEQRAAEAQELRREVQALQDQLGPLNLQRDHQEREIQRLNKALEDALSLTPAEVGSHLRKQDLVTQNELLKQQVKIFEEDFRRERSDRERMNEEKEALKRQLRQLRAQVPIESFPEHLCGACPCPYAHPALPARGPDDWAQIHYPPAQPRACVCHTEHPWRAVCTRPYHQTPQAPASPAAQPADPE
ncbi:TNFAIP3-interacting protein 1 isoform X2 [Sorex araneus]|uniref:TNFAIP3-interacting protein 1 isoform X2 n=1 Tax=Sorex araneus TaxID=42254 RepID=UPI0024336A20|nr:TNFAIP3-interacting protein 1 isoform X2 [Sorex araneus]